MYTSGTTGRPKGVVRDHGGYAVALNFSMNYVYGMHPGETLFTASDVGWVVGHSYIVYGPLLFGCSSRCIVCSPFPYQLNFSRINLLFHLVDLRGTFGTISGRRR